MERRWTVYYMVATLFLILMAISVIAEDGEEREEINGEINGEKLNYLLIYDVKDPSWIDRWFGESEPTFREMNVLFAIMMGISGYIWWKDWERWYENHKNSWMIQNFKVNGEEVGDQEFNHGWHIVRTMLIAGGWVYLWWKEHRESKEERLNSDYDGTLNVCSNNSFGIPWSVYVEGKINNIRVGVKSEF